MQFRVGTSNINVTRRDANWFARVIEIHAHPTSTVACKRAIVYFYGPEIEWDPASLGYRQTSGNNVELIVVMLPLRDYADAHRVLRSDAPAYVNWELGGNDRLSFFSLTTDLTPVGDGLTGYAHPVIPQA